MKKTLLALLLISTSGQIFANDCVILLHGLARAASSMEKLEGKLNQAGYHAVNIDYESRKHPIVTLAEMAVSEGLRECHNQKAQRIYFVTHSLGGILVRQYLSDHEIAELHRVVMLGPPNQGSEVVDTLRDVPGFEALNGLAGMQLGTSSTDIPRQLGPVDFELGVVAGTQSINLILSSYLPGTDDGKVTLESAQVKGMTDFITLPVTHPMMMKNTRVINQTLHFLQLGTFSHD
jgi:triacylglycerol esterase/lipase EstA (alpha/beta hydrolase family)